MVAKKRAKKLGMYFSSVHFKWTIVFVFDELRYEFLRRLALLDFDFFRLPQDELPESCRRGIRIFEALRAFLLDRDGIEWLRRFPGKLQFFLICFTFECHES